MEVVQGLSEPLLVDAIKNERPESLTVSPGDGSLPQPWVLTAGNTGLGIPETITIKEEPCDLAYEIRYANGNGEEDYVVQVADVGTENEGVPMLVSGTSDFIENSPIVLDNDDALGLRIVKTETLAGHAVSWEDEDISGLLDSQGAASEDRPTSGKKPSPGKCPILRNLLTIPALQGIVVESDQDETPSETSSVVNTSLHTPERSASRTPPAQNLASVADVVKEKEKKRLTRKEVAAKLKNTIQGRQKDKSPAHPAGNAEQTNTAPSERKTSSVSPRRRTSPRRPAEQNGPADAATGSPKTSKQGKGAASKTAGTKKGNESTSNQENVKVPEKVPEKSKAAALKDSPKDSTVDNPKAAIKAGKKAVSNASSKSGTRRTRASARAQQRKGKGSATKNSASSALPADPPAKSPSRSTGKSGESDKTPVVSDNQSKAKGVTTSVNKEPKKKKVPTATLR